MALRYIFVLQLLSDFECIVICQGDYLILEELHSLDDLDLLSCRSDVASQRVVIRDAIDRFALFLFTGELVLDFISKQVSCHHVHAQIDLYGLQLIFLLFQVTLLRPHRLLQNLETNQACQVFPSEGSWSLLFLKFNAAYTPVQVDQSFVRGVHFHLFRIDLVFVLLKLMCFIIAI